MESIILFTMKKRLPHYPLAELQARIAEQGIMVFTATALFNAAAMGLSEEQALLVPASLARSMFYKSMTTQADSTIWQDVYHSPTPNGKVAYIKLTLQGAPWSSSLRRSSNGTNRQKIVCDLWYTRYGLRSAGYCPGF